MLFKKLAMTLICISFYSSLSAMDVAAGREIPASPGVAGRRLRIALGDAAPDAPAKRGRDLNSCAECFMNAPEGLEKRQAAHSLLAAIRTARQAGDDENLPYEETAAYAKTYLEQNQVVRISFSL